MSVTSIVAPPYPTTQSPLYGQASNGTATNTAATGGTNEGANNVTSSAATGTAGTGTSGTTNNTANQVVDNTAANPLPPVQAATAPGTGQKIDVLA
jgi:hypothetical protein